MMSATQVQAHPASVDSYIRHGWSLVPIPAGTKGPRTTGWNKKDQAVKSQADLPQGYGIGLAHAYSGTMALDIDSWEQAVSALSMDGVDLNSLYEANDAVVIDSGRQGHGKLLYAMPPGLTLPSKKIIIDGKVIYELRCATANGLTVQDVLPPSIHPDTKSPYRWAGNGHWTRLPMIPSPILALWTSLIDKDKVKSIESGETVNASWDEIRSALEVLSAHVCRDDWVTVGMALKWAGEQTNSVDDALVLWNEWSATSDKYPGESENVKQWNSFRSDKPNTIKLGSLFHLARNYGWRRTLPDVSDMFSAIDDPADPLLMDMRPKPPVMDLSLWPSVLSRRAEEISQTVGCDPLVPLFAGLGAVCSVVDARTRLELIKDFKVPPILWLMTIGDPADKKTPGSAPMLAPLRDIEKEDGPRYARDLLAWEGKEAMYAASKKAFLDYCSTAEALMDSSQAPQVLELPPTPVPLRLTVDDITSQKLVRIVADRPRGVLCALDEMNSWVRKLTDKNSAEDRSAWVKSYESAPYQMDRVGAGSIYADNMAVSIYGNIQPRVFKEKLSSLSEDGLIQRFIPCVLDGRHTKKPVEIPDFMLNKGQWEQTLRVCYAMPVSQYTLSPGAKRVFNEFQNWYENQRTDERLLQSDVTFMTAFGKIEGLCGRIMLVFHLIEAPFSPTVSESLAARVVEIIKSYVVPVYRYALSELSEESTFDGWMRDYLIQHSDLETLTLMDIKRSARRHVEHLGVWQQDQKVYGAMWVFESAGWVARMDDMSKEKTHHAEWAINPLLQRQFKDYRLKVIDAKQRQLDKYFIKEGRRGEKSPRVHGFEG